MILFDFKCSNDHTTEHFVSSDQKNIECPECGATASRCIGGRPVLDPISGDFPGATMKWARAHEKAAQPKG